MKPPVRHYLAMPPPSHPTRVRGLKLDHGPVGVSSAFVAPHAGAWIETYASWLAMAGERESHPTRVRGLKPAC